MEVSQSRSKLLKTTSGWCSNKTNYGVLFSYAHFHPHSFLALNWPSTSFHHPKAPFTASKGANALQYVAGYICHHLCKQLNIHTCFCQLNEIEDNTVHRKPAEATGGSRLAKCQQGEYNTCRGLTKPINNRPLGFRVGVKPIFHPDSIKFHQPPITTHFQSSSQVGRLRPYCALAMTNLKSLSYAGNHLDADVI